MLYGFEVGNEKIHVDKIGVVEVRVLRCISRKKRKDRIRNEDVQDNLDIAPIEDKMNKNCLR